MVGGWDKARVGVGRLEGEDLWTLQEMEREEGDREGCHMCSAIDLGMRLGNWTWEN